MSGVEKPIRGDFTDVVGLLDYMLDMATELHTMVKESQPQAPRCLLILEEVQTAHRDAVALAYALRRRCCDKGPAVDEPDAACQPPSAAGSVPDGVGSQAVNVQTEATIISAALTYLRSAVYQERDQVGLIDPDFDLCDRLRNNAEQAARDGACALERMLKQADSV